MIIRVPGRVLNIHSDMIELKSILEQSIAVRTVQEENARNTHPPYQVPGDIIETRHRPGKLNSFFSRAKLVLEDQIIHAVRKLYSDEVVTHHSVVADQIVKRTRNIHSVETVCENIAINQRV